MLVNVSSDDFTGDCRNLVPRNVSEDIVQDWTLNLPNNGGMKLTMGAVWILVYYYAE